MKIKLFTLFLLLLSGCAIVRSPSLQPFSDAQDWIVRMPLDYEIGESKKIISVPTGFVTDFASVPPALRPFFPKLGNYLQAAIVHDYLYWNQSCSKKEADEIFYLAMKESDVGFIDRNAFFVAVDEFGTAAWNNNRKDKTNGYVKVIPESRINLDPTLTWLKYRKRLKNENIRDADPYQDLSKICDAIEKYID